MILLTCPRYCHNVFNQIIHVILKELTEGLCYKKSTFILVEDLVTEEDEIIKYTTIMLFGSQHFNDLSKLKKYCQHLIIFNLEQLHFQKWDHMIQEWESNEIDMILDYSLENLKYISENFPTLNQKIYLFSLGYSDFFEIVPCKNIDWRMAFIGNTSPHRFHQLSQITMPYRVYNNHYFNDYDHVVSQHHTFLNIHFQLPAILEIIRILPLVCNRKYIVSEYSMDSNLDDIFKDLVQFISDKEFETCPFITEFEYSQWLEDTHNAFQRFKQNYKMSKSLNDFFIKNSLLIRLPSRLKLKLCVATLHCNNRQTVFKTIKTFIENTDLSWLDCYETEWVILSQGSTEDHNDEIEQLLISYNLDLKITIIPLLVNMGWSKGMNELYAYIVQNNFTYVFHLEDDWICDPNYFSESPGKHWLEDCILYLDHNDDVSTLFLRQYRSKDEKDHYGWTRSFRYHCFQQEGLPFLYETKIRMMPKIEFRRLQLREIPTFMYTANPTIFRLADYIRCGVFPFPIFNDVSHNQIHWSTTTIEDAPEWGHAEALSMEKLLSLKCMNVTKGFFFHHF